MRAWMDRGVVVLSDLSVNDKSLVNTRRKGDDDAGAGADSLLFGLTLWIV